jgi:hypothetical protein
MAQLVLPISNLDERHPGLTPAVASCYHEAARVCLDRHHSSPISIVVDSEGKQTQASIHWEAADARCKAAHAYEMKATEEGAYACALAAVELTQGLVAIHQAESKTGADYYLGTLEHPMDDLENSFRLEVSGIDRCNQRGVDTRLAQKILQARSGKSNLPALAGVVGFEALLIKVAEVPLS